MRTIKFRGKSINSGKWVYAILHGFGMDWFDESVDEDTIGQFTGLHDANGKEIYEGDIFQVKAYEPKFEVFFKNGVFEYRQIGIPNRPYPLRRIYFDSYVLGNIHDNPELLKRDTK